MVDIFTDSLMRTNSQTAGIARSRPQDALNNRQHSNQENNQRFQALMNQQASINQKQFVLTDEAQNHPPNENTASEKQGLFGENGFEFSDLVDVINPLQNIPIVNSLYQNATGDETSTGARLMGGTLYGGPIGLLGAIIDLATQNATGKTIGGNVLSAVGVNQDKTDQASLDQDAKKTNISAAPESTAPTDNPPSLDALKNLQTELKNQLSVAGLIQSSQTAAPPSAVTIKPLAAIEKNEIADADLNEHQTQEKLALLNILDQSAPPAALESPPANMTADINVTTDINARAADLFENRDQQPRRNGFLSQNSVAYLQEMATVFSNQMAANQSEPAASIIPKSGFGSPLFDEIQFNPPARLGQSQPSNTQSSGLAHDNIYAALQHYEQIQQIRNSSHIPHQMDIMS
ncbi:MAG: hypothetical protein AB8B77_03700 [Alphaproteobacteria bacterium]